MVIIIDGGWRQLLPQNGIIMMKNILSFSMDENGKVQITTENEDLMDRFFNPRDETKAKQFLYDIIEEMIGTIWGERNTCLSKAVRLLSMAETCAGGAPYEQTEEYWACMMFGLIPESEKRINALKEMYGFKPKNVVRPVTSGPAGMFMSGSPISFPWRGDKWHL